VILDYDDTLLPTTFLDPTDELNMEELAKSHKDALRRIERHICELLSTLLKVSKVIIITNAKQGWVEYSSKVLIP